MSLLGIPSTLPSTMAHSEDQMDFSTDVQNRSPAMQDIDIDLEIGDDLEPTKEDENMMEGGLHTEELRGDNDDEMIDDTEQIDLFHANIRDVPVEPTDSNPLSSHQHEGDDDLIDPFADDEDLELETLQQVDNVGPHSQDLSDTLTAVPTYDDSSSNRIAEIDESSIGFSDKAVKLDAPALPDNHAVSANEKVEKETLEIESDIQDQSKLAADATSALDPEREEGLSFNDPNGAGGEILPGQFQDDPGLLDDPEDDFEDATHLGPIRDAEDQANTREPKASKDAVQEMAAPINSGQVATHGDQDAAASEPMGTPSNNRRDKCHTHPIVVHYQGSEVLLFAPDDENEQSEAYLLGDANLANDSLDALFEACRSVLEEDINEHEDFVIKFPSLDLEAREVCSTISCRRQTLTVDRERTT